MGLELNVRSLCMYFGFLTSQEICLFESLPVCMFACLYVCLFESLPVFMFACMLGLSTKSRVPNPDLP